MNTFFSSKNVRSELLLWECQGAEREGFLKLPFGEILLKLTWVTFLFWQFVWNSYACIRNTTCNILKNRCLKFHHWYVFILSLLLNYWNPNSSCELFTPFVTSVITVYWFLGGWPSLFFLFFFFQILKLGGIAYFLSKLMDPPSRDAVMLAINHLMELVKYYLTYSFM